MAISKKTRKFLQRHFNNAARLRDAKPKARLALRLLDRFSGTYSILPVAGFADASTVIAELAPGEPFEVTAPRAFGEAPRRAVGEMDPLRARRFRDVVTVASSSAICGAGHVAIPDYYLSRPDMVVSDRGFLIWHGADRRAIVYRGKATGVGRRGICLFGAGAFNWYHWLIDQLPAAFLAERLPAEYDDLPLIIPEEIEALPTFRDSLSLFSGDRSVETIGSVPSRFDELVVIDTPLEEPMNLRHGCWPTAHDYLYNPKVLREYREAILSRLEIDRRPAFRRIFLARAHGRRSYNQEEVLQIAARYGVEPVYPENMTFREQVQMMHDAEVIVGASGAAFATTLFCQPGTRLLSWLFPQYGGFCSYTNLAAITGSEIRYLFPEATTPIGSTAEGFSATYTLDPSRFEAALERTVANHSEDLEASREGLSRALADDTGLKDNRQ